jgi:hypothetical protein
MFEAAKAQPPREESFFSPGKPAVFGLFMILELAACEAGRDAMEVYEGFYGAASLDQGYGRAVTALLAAALADGMSRGQRGGGVCDDLLLRIIDLLDQRLGVVETAEELAELALLSEALLIAVEVGREFKGQEDHAFMEAFKRRVYSDSQWPFHYSQNSWRRNIDPLLFLMQVIAALAFAEDPMQALRVLAWGVADSDTVASVLGSLLGARLGYQQLLGLTSGGVRLADEFQAISDVLASIYGLDLDSRVEVFLPQDLI